MNDACTRWSRLADREALGEVLARDEQSYLRRHAASCDACSAEHAVWTDLEGLLEPRPAADVRPATGARTRTRRRSIYAVVAAAAILLFVSSQRQTSRPAHSPMAAKQATPRSEPRVDRSAATVRVLRAGLLEIDGRAASAATDVPLGARLHAREGMSCIALEGEVRACLVEGSIARVTDVRMEQRRIELIAGKIVAELEPQPAGSSFGIVTRDGAALAIGTAYSVEVRADGRASLTRVSHGTVLVRGSSGRERRVTAHFGASMAGDLLRLTSEERAREAALLAHTRDEARPSTADVAIVVPAAPMARTQPERTRGAESSARGPAPEPSPARLLAAARAHRARGDTLRAEDAYELLFRLHDRSSEARAARVPYGELALSSGRPERALEEFERYLREGGPLLEEAWFGRVRALRKLRRAPEAQRATREFLALFPDSPLARSLRTDVQP